MSSTSPQSSNLDAATIQVAEMLSTAAYDSLNGLSSDTNIQQLEAQGWNPVPTLPHQTDPNTSYQGIAFYKTINGVVQVVIANRGTVPTSVGDLTMDYDIAHNIQPPSDTSAQAYYQDVVSYFTGQGITNINVIETGHSLGGQEADFVATRGSLPAPTEAVTFDAPGIGPAAQTASSANAVNISNINDVIHLAGGTYVGNEATVSAPAPTLIDSAVGQALGAPLGGIGMLMGGMLGNVTANHAINDIASYLSADPALAAIDLSAYSAGQINQAVVNALAAMTPSQYYAMTSAQRAIFLAGVFSQYGSAGSSSGSISATGIQEAFTVVSSSPGAQTLTGSVGDSITLSSTGDALTSTASNGYTDTENFDATTGALTSDTWKNTIGTNGTDTYNTDGSSSSTVTYADGNYATTLDDGQGNITTDYYTKDGVEIRSTWVHSDGSSGTVDQYTDGQTLMPGGGTNPVPTTASGVMQNPDGSYTTVNWNAQNQSVTTNFAANGSQTSQSTGAGTGANDLTVASSSTAVVANLNGGYESVTTNHNAAGQDIGNTWYASYSDGTVDPNGDMITLATGAEATGTSWGWQGTTALSGSMTFDASGVQTLNIKALDGTSWVVTNEQQGSTVSHESSSGVLLSDQWAIADGPGVISGVPASASVTGTDSFNADGSGSGTFTDLRDGTSGTVTLNGQGDIVVVNTNASGTVTSEDTWNGSTDSYTVATLNGSGTTLNSYDYLANGNVIATDYAPDGTTIADQQTVAAGLVVNPDGSSFSKVVNADGSYTVYYMNASGDTTAYQYSASGQLTGTEHTSSYDWTIANASGTLSNGQSWTSPYNSATPTYTDSNGTTWTLYLNAASQTTGFDYVNKAAGTHGYGTYGSDGSLQEVEYAQNGTYEEIVQNSQGVVTDTTYFDASGNETGDAWTAPDGAHGGDTYNADGSSSGTSINADGSYGSYTDDGKGDMVSAEYSAAGVMLSEVWTNANGTSGNETFNAGGSTVTTSYNADGSYTVTTNDGKGDVFQTDYTAAGVKTGDAWQKADGTTGSDTFFAPGTFYNLLAEGQTTNPDGSSSQYQTILNSSNLVETDTTFYASGGVVSGTSKKVNNGNGTATINSYSASGTLTETMTDTLNSAGAVTGDTWTKADGSSGSDTFNADGSSSGTTINADGSTSVYANDGQGDITTDSYKASGVLSAVAWSSGDAYVTTTSSTQADGSVTTTSTNTRDHSGIVTTAYTDGSSIKTISDGRGDTTTDNFSASNVLTSDSWTQADGTFGSDVYNADGSSSSTVNDGQGNSTTDNYSASGVLMSDSWTKSDGTHGTDTYNLNGSSSSTTYSLDGSYTTTVNDGQGNQTIYVYASTGTLISDTWTKADGSSGSDTYNPDGTVNGIMINGTNDTLTAGSGNDVMYINGSGSIDTVYGGSGNDTMISYNDAMGWPAGTNTSETFVGGSGLDIMDVEENGNATFIGGSGGAIMIAPHAWSPVDSGGTKPSGNIYTYISGSGNDMMFAGPGSNIFEFSLGGGQDTIIAESDSNFVRSGNSPTFGNSYLNYPYIPLHAQNNGAIQFGSGIGLSDLSLEANGNDLIIHYSANDSVTLRNWFSTQQAPVQNIDFADGSSISMSDLIKELPLTVNNSSWTSTETWYSNVAFGFNFRVLYSLEKSGMLLPSSMATETSGSTSINADGSSNGTIHNSDGSYNQFTNDGAGDIKTLYYSSLGVLTSDLWTAADGSYGGDYYYTTGVMQGSVSYNADGTIVSTETYNSSGTLTESTWSNYVDGSHGSTTYNTDGSYVTITRDAQGNTSTDNYTAAGVLTGDTWSDANGTSGTDTYSSTGVLTQSTWTNADGSTGSNVYNSAGTLTETTWTNTDGSFGSITYNADGSYVTAATDATGNTSTDNYTAAGVLASDTWKDANGTSGTDTYSAAGTLVQSTWANPDGSKGSTTYNTDGSYVTASTDASGDTYTNNYTAAGVLTSAAWTHPDGSFGSTTYNADGSYVTAATDATGNTSTDNYTAAGVLTSDTWRDANGTFGADTYNSGGLTSQSTWTNPDGSTGSDTVVGNADVSLTFGSGTNTIALGNGVDTLLTTGGTNPITLGQGAAILSNSGATDTIALGASVNPDQLWFAQSGTDLVVSVLGSTENLTVKDWFNGLANQVSAFVAGNGQTLSGSNVDQLVQAMAAFSPPTSSQTSYTTAEATNLDPVIAANWH